MRVIVVANTHSAEQCLLFANPSGRGLGVQIGRLAVYSDDEVEVVYDAVAKRGTGGATWAAPVLDLPEWHPVAICTRWPLVYDRAASTDPRDLARSAVSTVVSERAEFRCGSSASRRASSRIKAIGS